MASAVYAFLSIVVMSVASSVAWFRNPNRHGHLPDLVHEMVPYLEHVTLPWLDITLHGLDVTEVVMSAFIAVTLVWVLTQPHRWLILRRALAIYGTLALLRSVTVLVTSLPDASPRCTHTTPGTVPLDQLPWKEALRRGVAIVIGQVRRRAALCSAPTMHALTCTIQSPVDAAERPVPHGWRYGLFRCVRPTLSLAMV